MASTVSDNPRPLRGRLAEIYEELDPGERDALMDHLEQGTSAEWLAAVLTRNGHKVSQTTIRAQRRAWKNTEGGSVDG